MVSIHDGERRNFGINRNFRLDGCGSGDANDISWV